MVKGLTALKDKTMSGFTPGEQLFVQLWTEAFHRHSIDACQARLHNAHTILRELAEVLDRVLHGACDEAHLDPLCRETLLLVKQDHVIRALLPGKANPLLMALGGSSGGFVGAKEGEVAHRRRVRWRTLLHRCHSVLRRVDSRYEDELARQLRVAIAEGKTDQIAELTGALASEALAKGRSPRSLYYLSKELAAPGETAFGARLEQLLHSLSEPGGRWDCHFQVISGPLHADGGVQRIGVLTGKVLRALVESHNANLATHIADDTAYAAVRSVTAVGALEAAEQALTEIEAHLDLVHLINDSICNVETDAIVVNQDSGYARRITRTTDGHYTPYARNPWTFDERTVAALAACLQGIDSRSAEQIQNALRFYRLGLTTHSPGPRFLNLWICLETIVRGQDRQAITERVINPVAALLARRYFYRLLRNLIADMGRGGITVMDLGIDPQVPRDAVRTLLGKILDETACRQIASALERIPLLAHRFANYCACFSTGSGAAHALEQQNHRFVWHLWRIYRVRNRLVHSADHDAPLKFLNGYLQSYCRGCLREVTALLSRPGQGDLGRLIQEVEDGLRLQRELLRAAGEDPCPVELLLDPPLSSCVWQ